MKLPQSDIPDPLEKVVQLDPSGTQLTFNPDTGMDQLFSLPLALALMFIWSGLVLSVFLHHPVFLGLSAFGLLAYPIGWLISRLVDQTYRIDLKDRRVTVQTKFAFWNFQRAFCKPEALSHLALEIRPVDKAKPLYGLSLHRKNARKVTLVDSRFPDQQLLVDYGLRIAKELDLCFEGSCLK